MENLFISYRRDDSSAYAGRICDHLTTLIGGRRVFMDVEDIQPGQNFAQAIEHTLSTCSHVLVVIGPRWHDILQARAQQSTEDYVLHEIATALTLKKTVVPLFVGGATPASLTALPASLADLSFHQAVELHDSSFNDDCNRLAAKLQLTPGLLRRPLLLLAAFAVLGLLVFLAAQAGLGPWHASHERKLQVARLMGTAETHVREAEYESAFQSYQETLALEPNNPAALDGQVNAAMLWLDHFHVLTPEGKNAEDIAAPILAQLNTVLTAGLARTSGKDKRAADILAHLGWLHWMNEKIAFKEFGNAERYFQQSLAIDPVNVYAHAFYGNWLLQSHGNAAQAFQHFDAALATNSQRELVRSMQLGGLLGGDEPGMRAAFVKALNQVRIGNEPLDPNIRDRVSYLYSPTVSTAAELHETLTAVPPDDAWKTFLWLTPDQPNSHEPPVLKDFVHASLAEISGDRPTSLAEFKTLAGVLSAKYFNGRIADYTTDAIRRLSH
jgi:tetratricopeptide (TPR) repeat protein